MRVKPAKNCAENHTRNTRHRRAGVREKAQYLRGLEGGCASVPGVKIEERLRFIGPTYQAKSPPWERHEIAPPWPTWTSPKERSFEYLTENQDRRTGDCKKEDRLRQPGLSEEPRG